MFQSVKGFNDVLLSICIFIAMSFMKLIVSIGLFIKGPAREKDSEALSSVSQAPCTSTGEPALSTGLQTVNAEKLLLQSDVRVSTLLGDTKSQVFFSATSAKDKAV